jgi:hypothetical protein
LSVQIEGPTGKSTLTPVTNDPSLIPVCGTSKSLILGADSWIGQSTGNISTQLDANISGPLPVQVRAKMITDF